MVLCRDAVQFITFTCESSKMLPFLEEEIKKNGGAIKQKIVNNFEELLDFDVVINCVGLKAEKLAEDSRVHPIRGQVTRVNGAFFEIKILFTYFGFF